MQQPKYKAKTKITCGAQRIHPRRVRCNQAGGCCSACVFTHKCHAHNVRDKLLNPTPHPPHVHKTTHIVGGK